MAAAPVGYRGRGPGDWDSYDLLGRSIYDILLRSQSPRTAISVFAQVNRQVDGARFRLEDFSSFGFKTLDELFQSFSKIIEVSNPSSHGTKTYVAKLFNEQVSLARQRYMAEGQDNRRFFSGQHSEKEGRCAQQHLEEPDLKNAPWVETEWVAVLLPNRIRDFVRGHPHGVCYDALVFEFCEEIFEADVRAKSLYDFLSSVEGIEEHLGMYHYVEGWTPK